MCTHNNLENIYFNSESPMCLLIVILMVYNFIQNLKCVLMVTTISFKISNVYTHNNFDGIQFHSKSQMYKVVIILMVYNFIQNLKCIHS